MKPSSRVFWQSQAAACSPGLLALDPAFGPLFWSVASPHPREVGVAGALAVGTTFLQHGADQGQSRPGPGLAGAGFATRSRTPTLGIRDRSSASSDSAA